MARYLALLAFVPLVTGADLPDCAVEGKGYNDPNMNSTANGNLAESAAHCMEECKGTSYCAYWTWYGDSKACWLQGGSATRTIVNEAAISGPVRCTTAEKAAAAVSSVSGTLNKATGQSLPWYAWFFIALLVAAFGLCCLLCICCSQNKKAKKTSRGAKVKKEEEPTTDSQPLMGTEAQLEAAQYQMSAAPMMAPAPVTYTVVQPAAYVVQPATYSVAPPATYSVAQPELQPATYSVAQPATYSVAQPVTYSAPVVETVQMVQAEPAAYMS